MSGAATGAVVSNERVKLTAAYLNTAAGAFLTAGVIAPFAATVFGFTGPSGRMPALTSSSACRSSWSPASWRTRRPASS